jgi:hypothetical protein
MCLTSGEFDDGEASPHVVDAESLDDMELSNFNRRWMALKISSQSYLGLFEYASEEEFCLHIPGEVEPTVKRFKCTKLSLYDTIQKVGFNVLLLKECVLFYNMILVYGV